jgi:hypothetical protein
MDARALEIELALTDCVPKRSDAIDVTCEYTFKLLPLSNNCKHIPSMLTETTGIQAFNEGSSPDSL